MSLPIRETPVLTGKDAIRFIKRMHEAETKPITKRERELCLRAKKTYDACVAAGHNRDFESSPLNKAKAPLRVTVERILGWERVLNDARITVGKSDLNKKPSKEFKKSILISEHSPIRKLMFEVTWENIPYWVGMHLRTHQAGFKSSDDDLYFVQTQRTDRTQKERDILPQNAPIRLRVILNAQTLINVSRVRLCHLASKETREAWVMLIEQIGLIEPELAALCVPNCLYRGGFCPEGLKGCGFVNTAKGRKVLRQYREFCL